MRDRKLGLHRPLRPRASIVVSPTEDDVLFPEVTRAIGPEPMAWQIFNRGPLAVERIELTPFGAANEALALKDYPIPPNRGHLARRSDGQPGQEDLDLTWPEFALKFGGFTDFSSLRKLFWEEDAWSSEYPNVDVAALGRVTRFSQESV
ncbi:hypothetical protein VARIO8X_60519 [Burkholderiales bacterium 8X]|nr:hypothetical protein VARIO8X_60519 [Burkholderiales bacterium 8X]